MKQLRFIKCDYSYADFSTSISPAVEKGLENGVAPDTVLLDRVQHRQHHLGLLG